MTLTIGNYSLKSLTPAEFKAAYIKVNDLGEGGSASVASYIEVATGREVAIKQIGESRTYPLLKELVEIPISEYECLRKLDGIPGVPKVYDLFVVEIPRAYIFNTVMDVVKSKGRAVSIAQMQRAGKITLEFLDRFIPWLLRIVAAVHDCGVVHRDIVGMNILVDTDGYFYLFDLGEGYEL